MSALAFPRRGRPRPAPADAGAAVSSSPLCSSGPPARGSPPPATTARPRSRLSIGAPLLIYMFRRPGVAMLGLLAVVSSLRGLRNAAARQPARASADQCRRRRSGRPRSAGRSGGGRGARWPPVVRGYVYALVIFIGAQRRGHGQDDDARPRAVPRRRVRRAQLVLPGWPPSRWRSSCGRACGSSSSTARSSLGALVSVFAIVASASGSVQHFIQQLSPVSVYSSSSVAPRGGVDIGGIARIRVQGLFFIYAMVLPTLVLVLTGRERRALRDGRAVPDGRRGRRQPQPQHVRGLWWSGLLVAGTLAGARVRLRMAMSLLAVAAAATVVVLTLGGAGRHGSRSVNGPARCCLHPRCCNPTPPRTGPTS